MAHSLCHFNNNFSAQLAPARKRGDGRAPRILALSQHGRLCIMEYRRTSYGLYYREYRLIITTKYRRKVINAGVWKHLKRKLLEIPPGTTRKSSSKLSTMTRIMFTYSLPSRLPSPSGVLSAPLRPIALAGLKSSFRSPRTSTGAPTVSGRKAALFPLPVLPRTSSSDTSRTKAARMWGKQRSCLNEGNPRA